MRLSEYKAHNTTYHGGNYLKAKISNYYFYPLEGVSRYRDPQHRTGENIYICLASNQAFLDAYWMMKPNYEIANFIKITLESN